MTREYQIVHKLVDQLKQLVHLPENATPTKERIINAFVAAVITRSHIILHGPPGCAKSTIVKLVAKAFGIEGGLWRVNGTLGTKEEDLVGGLDLVALTCHQRAVFYAPFVDAPIRLLDEANRINEFATSPLLPLLGEGEARIGGTDYKKVPKRFTAFTINPPEPGQGNFDLTKPLRDRMDLEMHFPDIGFEEMELVLENNEKSRDDLVQAMPVLGSPDDLYAIQKIVEAIPVAPEALTAIGLYFEATRSCKKDAKAELRNFPACCAECEMAESSFPCSKVTPLSPRAGISAKNLAKGMAFLRRAPEAGKSDVDDIFPFVLSHRVSFPNQAIDNLRTHVFSFFVTLQAEVNYAFQLLTAPENLQEEELKQARSRAAEKNGNPLVKKVLMLQRTKTRLTDAGEQLKKQLAGMKAPELKKIITKSGLTMAERQLVERMILARKLVHLQVGEDALKYQPFRDLFTSPEGQPYFEAAAWDDVVWDGKIGQGSLLGGLDMQYRESILSVQFDDADQAEAFTERLRQAKGDFTLLCPYEQAGLRADLEKAGILATPHQPNTTTPEEMP